MRRLLRQLAADREGVAVAEFALWTTLLFVVVLAGLDFGGYFHQRGKINEAVSAAAMQSFQQRDNVNFGNLQGYVRNLADSQTVTVANTCNGGSCTNLNRQCACLQSNGTFQAKSCGTACSSGATAGTTAGILSQNSGERSVPRSAAAQGCLRWRYRLGIGHGQAGMISLKQLRDCRTGSTLVEFALVAPVFLGMLLGIVEVSRVFWNQAVAGRKWPIVRPVACRSVPRATRPLRRKAMLSIAPPAYRIKITSAAVVPTPGVTCKGAADSNSVTVTKNIGSPMGGLVPSMPSTLTARACFPTLS